MVAENPDRFEYDCLDCGSHDELSPAGGNLSCTCETPNPERLKVTTKLNGAVLTERTMSEEREQ